MKTKRLALFGLNILVVFVLISGMSGFFQGSVGRAAVAPEPPDPGFPERQPAQSDSTGSVTPSTVNPASAVDLAIAMGVPAGDLVSADLMGSDPAGVGISDAHLGNWFPTQGSTFTILSNGYAADATLDNDSGSHSSYLDGLDNDVGEDMVRLNLNLNVPEAYNCVNFDFAFYSEEFPEFVGSSFNDTFTAQLNNADISVDPLTDTVIAPGNFAFDSQGNAISVNTVFGVSADTGTTYDGSTPTLRASAGVTPGANINIYLSIQDLGDSSWDSAVFLDRFFWSDDDDCIGGAAVDTDGDGLLDIWETDGLTINGETVDLPAMGADPMHKDIFVEIDWMGDPGDGHSHAPAPDAIQVIVDAFDNAPVSNPDGIDGIHLHVDYGPNSPLTWGAADTWGSLSDGDELAHQTNISTCGDGGFSWSGFDTIKNANFLESREAVFHYNVWGHSICSSKAGTSGISRNSLDDTFGDGASDFIVSMGLWPGQTGTEDQQAGTFMHELGHNLGLRHGGEDHVQWKPNYLSVMNYSFQTRGLPIDGVEGNFDYSRWDLSTLFEPSLDEPDGIYGSVTLTEILGTRYFCGMNNMKIDMDGSSVDWNCDSDEVDRGIRENINEGTWPVVSSAIGVLTSQNDWLNLVFAGGSIGAAGADIALPEESEVIDITEDQDDDIPPSSPGIDVWVKVSPYPIATEGNEVLSVPIWYNNYGMTTANSTVLTLTLDSGLSFMGDNAPVSPTVTGNTIVWDFGDLPLTGGGVFNVQLSVPHDPLGSIYTSGVEITSHGVEADPDDNAATLTIQILKLIFLPQVTR